MEHSNGRKTQDYFTSTVKKMKDSKCSQKPRKQKSKAAHNSNVVRVLPNRACKQKAEEVKPNIYVTAKNLDSFHKTNLETIFEEPKYIPRKDSYLFMGTKKQDRKIELSVGIKAKQSTLKKRRTKIQKYFGQQKRTFKLSKDWKQADFKFDNNSNQSIDTLSSELDDLNLNKQDKNNNQ